MRGAGSGVGGGGARNAAVPPPLSPPRGARRFTELGQGLFQLLQLLRALEELRQKVTYERDPLKAETPLLERRLRELLTHLLKRWGGRGAAGGGRREGPGRP